MRPKRILIVDDDSAISSLTATMVRRLGHNPVVAWSVESALSLWGETENAFDLALIDYVLNDGLGTSLASQIKRDKPTMPVLVVTGMNEGDFDLPAGIGYLGKPFSLDRLRAALANIE